VFFVDAQKNKLILAAWVAVVLLLELRELRFCSILSGLFLISLYFFNYRKVPMRGLRKSFVLPLFLISSSVAISSYAMSTRIGGLFASCVRTATARCLTPGRYLSSAEKAFWLAAVQDPNVEQIKKLLRDSSLDPNFLRRMKNKGQYASYGLITPLAAAAMAGYSSIVKAMLFSSCRVNVNDGGYAFEGSFPLTPLDRVLRHIEYIKLDVYSVGNAVDPVDLHDCLSDRGILENYRNQKEVADILSKAGGTTRFRPDECEPEEWML